MVTYSFKLSYKSNHPLFLLYCILDALKSTVHHSAVKRKQLHVLLYLPLLIHAFFHHSLDLAEQVLLVHRVATWTMWSHHHLWVTIFGSQSVHLRSPELEVVLALFKHYYLVTLLFPIETSLFEFLLKWKLQFLVLNGFSSQSHAFFPFEHFRLDSLKEAALRSLFLLWKRSEIDG